MKKWILLFAILISFFGCSADDPTIDGVVTKDAQGNVYLIEHHPGFAYTVKKIPASKLTQLP